MVFDKRSGFNFGGSLLFWMGLVFWGMPLFGSTALNCLQPFHKLSHPKYDTAVELEMVSDPPVLKLFTPKKGSIAGIFERGEVPDAARALFPGKTDKEILQTEWRDLAPYKQLEILRIQGKEKSTSFFEDRKIPNMKYEEALFADVKTATDFLGKHYPEGLHTIRPPEFLKGDIEYMGPFNFPGGVELHFRVKKSAGETSQEARNFQKLIGVNPTHQHVYVVAPIPQKRLEKNPVLIGTQNAEFYRRVNLAAELMTIMEFGGDIKERHSKNGGLETHVFGALKPSNLVKMADYLVERGKGIKGEPLKDQLKMAWVGFRGADKFDEPDLMGMEFRSISALADLKVYERLLDTVQKAWLQQKMGISQEKIKTWLEEKYQGNYQKALKDNWYQNTWPEVVSKAPSELRSEVGFLNRQKLSARNDSENTELKMLFHDWSKDPLFFEDLNQQEIIRKAQVKAVKELKKKDGDIQTIMTDFLTESGIYEATLKSLNP
ncbi:MAG: hypothetical protein EBQ92_09265 [Proteobacteria bacterium]|nr:hypothetical protein [Pseudomonadota bacterium]